MKLDPTTISAVAALLTAIAGLWTAIHAHGKATQASSSAQDAATASGLLQEIVHQVLPLLAESIPANSTLRVTSGTGGGTVSIASPPADIIPQLVSWLREQHKNTTGQYPVPGSSVATDFSKVLEQISRLQADRA